MQGVKRTGAALIALAFSAGAAEAAVIGIYGDSQTQANAAAVAAGHTAINLAGLSAGDLTGKDVIWVLNGDNGAQSPGLVSNAAAISAWVNAGGRLLVHDRWAQGSPPALPGSSGVVTTRNLDSNIDVPLTSPYFGGPIGNTTLDGGNFSSHGWSSPLPAGAVVLLSDGSARAIDFSYLVGAGSVYYSTVPLDFYLQGGGNNGNSFRNIYTPEVLKYVTDGAGGGGQVSEPATLALVGAGLLGLAAVRRRRTE
jgi:hypothetical protein